MRYLLLTVLCAACCIGQTFAQDLSDEFVRKHLKTEIFLSDTDASAVVLYEKGTIQITEIANQYMQVYKIQRIIKILKEDAINEANISEVYRGTSMTGYVLNVKGNTYNMAGDEMVKTPLGKSAIYNTDHGENIHEMKFALPAVKVGSVISYSYDVYTRATMLLPSWYFQNEYPTLKSEYEVNVPKGYPFAYVTQATPVFKGYAAKRDADNANAEAYVISANMPGDATSVMMWGRKNIRAMRPEPFAGNVIDYAEKVEVQLQSPDANVSVLDSNGIKKLWRDYTHDVLSNKKIGKQIERSNSFLEPAIKEISAKYADELPKARAVFRYVCNNVHCNDSISLNPERDIEKVFSTKDGNAAEINLLLTAMLRKAGLTAAPVVLSTWGRPKAYHDYPMHNSFNHMVCMVTIDGTKYFLDAGGKYNAFGRLPHYCYTGYARVIEEDGGYVVLGSKQNREKSVYAIKVTEFTRNSMTMQVTQHMGMNASRMLRKMLDEDSVKLSGYLSSRVKLIGDGGTVTNVIIENSKDPDTNLIIRSTVSKKFDKAFDIFYLNADQLRIVEGNPYKPMKRVMPVELMLMQDESYVMSLQLPENMELEELPKSAKVNFEDKVTFRHLINYSKETNFLSITTQLKHNETFSPQMNMNR